MHGIPTPRVAIPSIVLLFAGTWVAAAIVCGASDATWVACLALPPAFLSVELARRRPAAVAVAERAGHSDASVGSRSASNMSSASPARSKSSASSAVSAHARAEFLMEMSHELRTPMNGVLGMAELLAETRLTPEQSEYLDALQRSGENLLNVITDTLDLAKIEAGELAIEPMPFDVRSLVEDAAQSCAADADRRGLELVVRCVPDVPRRVTGDCGRIRQVLVNLCSNALKFTPRGSVVIEATRIVADGGASIAFSVTDSGTGISADKLGHVFERPSQGDAAMTLRLGGTGRGLTISLALARLMDGDIQVESEIGKGSRFRMTLPLPADDSLPNASQQRVDLAGRRVLVVDDLEINRCLMLESLNALGARCEAAGSEAEALSLLRAGCSARDPFELAFIDVEMPDTTGTVLCHLIKGELETASPRFVLMASATHRARTRTWQLAGFEACLQKPMRRADLEDCLIELLSRAPESSGPLSRSTGSTGSNGSNGSTLTPPATSVHHAPPSARSHKELVGLNVLIVEDNLVNQRVAERILEKLGCNVTIADNGQEALALVDQTPFDLILMDCQMPVLDGFLATEELRRRELSRGSARVPVIALTANAMKGDRDHCIASGMDDHLSKPIVREDLIAALLRWRPRHSEPYSALPSQRIAPQSSVVSPVPNRSER